MILCLDQNDILWSETLELQKYKKISLRHYGRVPINNQYAVARLKSCSH